MRYWWLQSKLSGDMIKTWKKDGYYLLENGEQKITRGEKTSEIAKSNS